MAKLALVTGAYRGLGKETCRQLLDHGLQVILTSRNAAKGEAAVKELNHPNLHYRQLDITDSSQIDEVVTYVKKRFGRLDILINNAGIHYDSWQTAERPDFAVAEEAWQVNLMGAWRMAVAFLPMMKEAAYGRIVNVSSGAGAINGMGAGTPAYSISKAAMNVLSIKLAAELNEDDIKVNSVCPGWVRTEMGGSAAPRSVEEGAKGIVWAALLDANGPSGGFFRDGKAIDY